ncbi:MAG: hypothetical protein AB4372_24460 [Xenococcus sp. (in: cyanobacteria)]
MAFDLGDIDRRSQMRVANILTCLGWEKLGQQQHSRLVRANLKLWRSL